MKKILVTGSSGFIGMHLCKELCLGDFEVFGVDNLNNYYDKNLKKHRNQILERYKNFSF